jgi:flagellar biosynthesis chaperone FliJ
LRILQKGIDLKSNLAARMIMNPLEETVEQYQHLLRLLKQGVEQKNGE